MNSKEKNKPKPIRPQSAKTTPKVFEKNKVIEVPFEEDPFENAIRENEKIELKSEQERLKLIDFNRKVKERIREYKFAKQKLEEDAQLIIHKKPSNYTFKKKNLDKIRSKSALDLRNSFDDDTNWNSKRSTFLSLTCRSVENLSSFALRTIFDKKDKKEEYKKRIKSTRKIYSNMERDKVRNDQIGKNFKTKLSSSKPELKKNETKKSLKKRDTVKIERNQDCLLNKKSNNNELKQFIFETDTEPIDKKKEVEKTKIHKKIPTTTNTSTKIQNLKPKHEQLTKLDKYIIYMKQVLKEKAIQSKVEIPPLCQCHLPNFRKENLQIWDVDWNKCANNCIFYQNPKEYARVLFNLVDKNVIEKDQWEKFEHFVTV